MALENLKWLRDCEVHITHIPTPGDEAGLRKLKVNLTCDPEYSSKTFLLANKRPMDNKLLPAGQAGRAKLPFSKVIVPF